MMIKTLAFIINDTNHSLAVATLAPDFALIPVNKVRGDFVVLNDVFLPNTQGYGQVLALGNARYKKEEFWTTFVAEGDILDGQVHAVHRI